MMLLQLFLHEREKGEREREGGRGKERKRESERDCRDGKREKVALSVSYGAEPQPFVKLLKSKF